jgi:hypothetical protein
VNRSFRAHPIVALWLVAVAAPAQTQAPQPSLHDAWIRETLDLDIRAAIRGYREVARDESHTAMERRVAAARLEELRRIGVIDASENAAATLLPEQLLAGDEAKAQETNAKAAADMVRKAPRATNPGAAELPNEVPQLRPLVSAVLQLLRAEATPNNPSRGGLNRSRGFGESDTTRILERLRASDIARADLAGKPEEADALRLRSFPAWKPQPWPTDAAAAWTAARANLVEWQAERQLSSAERETLQRLLAALDEDAKTNPARALARIDRLPFYAERLRAGIPAPR